MENGEREALLGESPAPNAGVGDTKWSPHAVAVKAGDGWRAWAVPAGSSAALVLFVVAQTSAMWIAEGQVDVALPGRDPSNSHASVSYNLPDTVLELFRTNEHLLGALVLVFSGIWPHLKLVSALVAWFTPASEQNRARWLQWSSIFAAWSFLDVAVVILCSIVLRASIHEEVAGLAAAGFTVAVHPLGGCYWFCTAVILSAVVSHVAVTHHAALARTRVHAPNLEKEEETKLSHTREWTVSETACEGRPVVRFLVYSGLTICAALTVVGSVSPWAAAEYRLPVFNDDTKLGVRDKWVVLIEDFAARGHGHGHGHGHDATTKASVEAMVTLLEAGGALPDVPVLLPKSWSPVQAAWELANLPAEVDGIELRSNEREGFPNGYYPVGQWFLSLVFMIATVAAPIARIVVHWLAWTSTWFGLKDHDTLVSFGVVCGRACGVEVTLLALIVLCARMGEASESLSEKFGGCVHLDDDERQCFTATLRVEHGAWIALGGALASAVLTWVLGRLHESARAAVVAAA